jgi:hypothetical protein
MGQSRPVHAVHLIATRTAEQQVLARLAARLDRVRAAVGNVDHILGPITPEWLAEQALCAPGPLRSWPRVDPAPPRRAPGGAREDAERELERLERHRRLRLPPSITITGKGPTWWTRMSRGPWPAGYLAALRVVVEDGLSMPVGQFPIACRISTARTPVARPAATPAPIERAIVETARRRLEPALRARARVQTRFLADRHARFLARAIAREQALLRRITDVPATPRQTALFDRRAIRRAATEQRLRERLEEECRTRLARLRHAAERRHVRVELRLVARLES